LLVLLPMFMAVLLAAGWWLFGSPTRASLRNWLDDPYTNTALITDLSAPCPGAPFLLPSKGFIGFLYADPTIPYSPLNQHTGIDIFGLGDPGTVPVYAAYDGYLTRLDDWKSAVIIRIPDDPLVPGRQIWTYYAHMANRAGDTSFISPEFPPGTFEKFVKQGTLLGYQGLYSGTDRSIALHVHFSIVLTDAAGSFRNEARFINTIDPSPYFGLQVNATEKFTIPAACVT
jgi:peptidoglycan LD-endopeptidase LytH